MALLIDQGVELLEIWRQMGHASIAITDAFYSHLYEGSEQREAAALDAGWREAGQGTVVAMRVRG